MFDWTHMADWYAKGYIFFLLGFLLLKMFDWVHMFIIVTWQVLRAPKTRIVLSIHNSLWKLMYWFRKLITKLSWIYPLGQTAKDLIPKWPQSQVFSTSNSSSCLLVNFQEESLNTLFLCLEPTKICQLYQIWVIV